MKVVKANIRKQASRRNPSESVYFTNAVVELTVPVEVSFIYGGRRKPKKLKSNALLSREMEAAIREAIEAEIKKSRSK